MLTKEEKDFIVYWRETRKNKGRFLRKLSIGMPLGILVVLGLAGALFAAGFHRKGHSILHNNAALIMTVMLAGLAIVVFISLFSAHHKWDQNEQYYGELLSKQEQENAAGTDKIKST